MTHDQSLWNTSFFRPELRFGNPRTSVKASRLFNPRTGHQQVGLLLGGSTPVAEIVQGKTVLSQNHVPRPNAIVLWASDDSPPEVVRTGRDEIIKSGSVLTIPTDKGGKRHIIVEYAKDGKCLVHIQTGMFGKPDMNALADHLKTGGLFAHGSFALERDAASAVETQESSDTDAEHAPQHEIARRIHWRVGKKIGGMEIPFRREDVWEVPLGASLLVGGIYENELCRLVNDKGVMRKVDAPKHGRALLDEYEVKRLERNAAERKRRADKKASQATGMQSKDSGTEALASAPNPDDSST